MRLLLRHDRRLEMTHAHHQDPAYIAFEQTAPEWAGMHAALTAAAVLSGVAAGVRVLASLAIASYIRVR